jgi:hypothetical protein
MSLRARSIWVPVGIKPVLRPGPSPGQLVLRDFRPNYMQPEYQTSYKGFRIVALVDRLPESKEWKSEVLIFPLSPGARFVKDVSMETRYQSDKEAVYASFDLGQFIIDREILAGIDST